jgi:diaminohydroxyphosphoribosylaminopyrimidine deaminase / 5-amino-6-(5-phosphoribosylamino)uracil reductase
MSNLIKYTEFDRQMIRRCVDLAKQAWGKTAPNPLVGAVIVQDGKIIGEGFHPGVGQPHAEIFALRSAGKMPLEQRFMSVWNRATIMAERHPVQPLWWLLV